MEFFDNDIIRAEAAELMQTFEEIQDLSNSSKFYSREGGMRYFELMERLLELQEMIYFRAKYSNKDDAKEFVDVLSRTLPFVAREGETDASQVLSRMRHEVSSMKKLAEES